MIALKNDWNIKEISEDNVDLLKVISHPVRLQIVNELMHHKKCNVTQLTEILRLPQSTVSQHLSKLRRTVLLTERRGLEVYYYIGNAKASQIVEILGL
ncbi:ArsR family transcriptional regulator [Bacillus toyonensis]|uniref:ArsR/SmtB family transcription factor n=1 Tax=Bacillus toyonensis TaxID=155322 RepID=UPI00103E03AC|nr:metalloregulator ArsR/SmtB family transcription factor [Bacillus toyonensis]TBX46524.1 ArsR family transcriptional regulator [Bacillus toyonensis]